MTYNADGQLIFKPVAGTSLTGLYAVDGSYNVVLTTENTTWKGLTHPCGAYWGTIVVDYGSYYAIDGTVNIISNGDGTYSPAFPMGNASIPSSNFTFLIDSDGALLVDPNNTPLTEKI